ncbi:MAG: histidine phosphatase family protein [Elainella sp. Prado103]|jgi:probable phosphoglycerate mutase|nr:histidine phosphatase family protein [Elainella sp. Prado103]
MISISTMPDLLRTTRVILVRHGRSTFNQQGRFQGSCDQSLLAEQGRIQAQQVATLLRDSPIDAVFSSPLQRAQATLQEILAGLQLSDQTMPVYSHEHLREIDIPAWEGLPFHQVRSEQAESYRQWQLRPHEFTMHRSIEPNRSIEALASSQAGTATAVLTRQPVQTTLFYPVLDLYERARSFWQQVLPHRLGQTLLIVSHGGTNHALISTALGLSAAQHHRLQQSNGGISLLSFAEACPQSGQLHCLNTTAHLDEILPKLKAGKQGLRLILAPLSSDREQWQKLRQRFETIQIDFSLSKAHPLDDPSISSSQSCSADAMLDILLSPHPHTVRLETTRHDFPRVWQQTIDAQTQRITEPTSLLTGLVLASETEIRQILAQAIGLNPLEDWRLPIDRSRFSLLHYPGTNHPPVVQGFNLE